MKSALGPQSKAIYKRHIGRWPVLHPVFLATLAFILLAPYAASDQIPATQTKNVLVLFDEQEKLPGLAVLDQTLRATLKSDTSINVEVYSESLDRARFKNAEEFQSDYLQEKYGDKKLDVIIAVMGPSLDFLLAHGNEIAPGTPIVFCGVDRREIETRTLGPNMTGVLVKRDFKETLELALKVQPETRNVVFIAGSSSFDKRVADQAIAELRPYEDRLSLQYWTDFELNDLLGKVSKLPPNTIILTTTVFSDNTGRALVPHDVVSLISQKANAPLYGFYDQIMGRGIVGGHLYSVETHGEESAKLALRVLKGEKASDIPVVEAAVSKDVFDGRELERWGLHEERLPIGSIIRFREPTFWQKYQRETISVSIFIVLQTFLIGWLLFLRRKKNIAEKETREYASLAASEHKKLDDVVANIPGIVWESRMGADLEDRRIEFISDHAEKILGYTPKEIEALPNFWHSIILKEDQPALDANLREIFLGRDSGVQLFRCRRKDGRIVWLDAHLVATYDEGGTVVGLRGVAIDVTDRKQVEVKLQERELDLSEAQRLSQIGSWTWDPATDETTWSEELYRIAGINPLLPAPNWEQHKDLYTPESYERLAAGVANALETGEPYAIELEMIRSDGRHVWVNGRGEALRDENGRIDKFRGTLQDISEFRKAQDAVVESEERYRNVVETQTELICRYLPDTTLTFVNDAYCRLFNKRSDELIGTKFIDLIPERARMAVLEQLASIVEEPRSETYEHEVIRPDGKRGWHQWTDTLVEVAGKPLEFQGIGRDVTERREVEEQLRLSETRFRNMADAAPLMIWMCGPDKLCNYVNQGWLDFTGRTLEMEVGSGWVIGIHEDDEDRVADIFDRSFDARGPFKVEYRLRGADGDYRWVYDSGTPRFSSEGEFLGFIGSCVDISERKVAEDDLKRALTEVSDLQKQLHEENIYLREVIELEHHFEELIGHSDALKYVLFKIEQVSTAEATVLITGETGTGKELVARAVHNTSKRKSRPLVKVNSAALSSTLIESELFGHERGSFTGANARKIGRFELADGATIFLDEIGELPLELQAKLFRVIQDGEFERLGSSKTIKSDARIIAATNRNLEHEVKRGNFREDLLFRLNVFPITVPPLRERKEDIRELVEYFAERFSKKIGKSITSVSPVTIRRLTEHSWPGNIRELANVIERSVINSQSQTLVVEDMGKALASEPVPETTETLEVMERRYIMKVLAGTGWKIEGANGAARVLGLNPSTLRTRMAKLGISKNQGQAYADLTIK